MNKPEVVIVNGARTAFGTFGGSLKDFSATELGVVAAKGALERSGVETGRIDNIVFGNVVQTSGDAIFLPRHIGLKVGCPLETPALGVNRLCGSGLQAVVTAAESMMVGDSEWAIAGGTENMSQAPHVIRGARWGLGLGQGQLEDMLWVALIDTYVNAGMAITAENVAEKYNISREECDHFALESQMKAKAAIESGRLAEEIVPVMVKDRKGNDVPVDRDEHPRPDATLESLAKLKARFRAGGVVTPANASGINDGAAAVVMTTGQAAGRAGLKPLARIVSWGVCGCDPSIMGIGPAPAARQALKRAGLKIEDMDIVEVNEAFAAQYLGVEKDLGLDRSKVNVNGGAIALGHPLGASGARLALTTAYELRKRKARYGLAGLCIGGGQGIAVIFENLG